MHAYSVAQSLLAPKLPRERRGEQRTMVKTEQEPSQDTQMVQERDEQGTVSAARELCRAGGALVAAARDEGTAAELAAMFAALQAAAAGRLARLQGEARLRARFEERDTGYMRRMQ